MAGIPIKLNKNATLYHAIWYFVNMKQGEAKTNNVFKLCFW